MRHSVLNLRHWQRQNNKIPKDVNICCEVAPVFYNHPSSKLDVQEAGGKLLLDLYNRVNIGSLNKLERKIFMKKVVGKSVVELEQQPPPTKSSKYHFFDFSTKYRHD